MSQQDYINTIKYIDNLVQKIQQKIEITNTLNPNTSSTVNNLNNIIDILQRLKIEVNIQKKWKLLVEQQEVPLAHFPNEITLEDINLQLGEIFRKFVETRTSK
jgi:hypothetical protein